MCNIFDSVVGCSFLQFYKMQQNFKLQTKLFELNTINNELNGSWTETKRENLD